MFVHVSNILFFGAIILFIGIIVSKFGSKLGVPSLLLFLMIGIFFGEGGLGIRIKNPELVQLIGMISLNIILFSGGMDTKMKDISKVVAPGILLSTLGVMLTALITGTFIFMITKNSETSIVGSFLFCFLLAATMASTDSASVFNVFKERKIGLKYHLKPMLELESGSNDPMAYMLTIALIGLCT
ncbi:MAG: cation:proton antiporter, partial [Bacteroidales bacterium]|nr:cation:proton antiporter [Bacteroidales bacterium]